MSEPRYVILKGCKHGNTEGACRVCKAEDVASAERARADSLAASITTACAGTGCVNAHELAEALRQAREQLDTYIKVAADAVAEQGRCETAGMVLAKAFVATSDALTVNAYTDKAYSQEQISARTKNSAAAKDVYESVLALAWVKAAQEASNG